MKCWKVSPAGDQAVVNDGPYGPGFYAGASGRWSDNLVLSMTARRCATGAADPLRDGIMQMIATVDFSDKFDGTQEPIVLRGGAPCWSTEPAVSRSAWRPAYRHNWRGDPDALYC